MYIHMGMRATVIQYSINVRTPKKEKCRTKPELEQIWNGFKMFLNRSIRIIILYRQKNGKQKMIGEFDMTVSHFLEARGRTQSYIERSFVLKTMGRKLGFFW